MIFHAGASNGDAPVWQLVSPEARLMETVGACNERLLSVSRFQEKEKRGEMITKNDNIK